MEIRDCMGRLVCVADASTGFVEVRYKGVGVKLQLNVGATLDIDREGVLTSVTRASPTAFSVESHRQAA